MPKKVGMAPIMRDGVEYEFTTVFDLDVHHQAQASKDRTQMFSDNIFQITEETGALLRRWLDESADQPVPESNEDRSGRLVNNY
jgi:hypothetical protein